MLENKILNEQTKEKKYDLKNDILFKTFFSRKGNEEYLIDFLEALLKIEIAKIKIKEEVNLEQLAQNEKGGRLDLQAELNDGVIVNIELQIRNQNNMEKRSLLYGAKTVSREVERGAKYEEIKEVIMINILNYEMLGFDEYVSETVTVLDKHREYEVIKGMKWYFIELPKFRKAHPDMEDKLNQWIAFIDNYDRGLVKMAEEKNKTIEKAREEMNYLTGDAAVRRLAELREKWEHDYADTKEFGRKEGLEQGRAEGSIERTKEIAKELLKKGFEIHLISEVTKLTVEEIEKIKDNL